MRCIGGRGARFLSCQQFVSPVTNRNAIDEKMPFFRDLSHLNLMPTIRFVREGKDIKCDLGANLREVALSEGIELYGLKGSLGNCNGCGQCITCFVGIVGETSEGKLSPLTEVEKSRLRKRPSNWRLACQVLVLESVIVLTKPQASFKNSHSILLEAKERELPI